MSNVPSTRYGELHADPALSDRIRCLWRFRQDANACAPTRVLPDGCIDLIWDGRRLFVAGPDRTAAMASLAPGAHPTGVRLAPGAGAAVLGVPPHLLTDLRVPLEDLWGHRARRLQARLEDGADPAALLQAGIAALQLAPDRSMAWLFARLAGADAPRVPALARELGVSERTLRRRCQDAFGYGGKTLDRILRLQRILRLAREHPTLTAAALEAGYADAAHLARDTRLLTALAPQQLVDLHDA